MIEVRIAGDVVGEEGFRSVPEEEVAQHVGFLVVGLKQPEVDDLDDFNGHVPGDVLRVARAFLPMNIRAKLLPRLDDVGHHPVVHLAVRRFRTEAVSGQRILLLVTQVELPGIVAVPGQLHLEQHLVGMDAPKHRVVRQIDRAVAEHLEFMKPDGDAQILVDCRARALRTNTARAEHNQGKTNTLHRC